MVLNTVFYLSAFDFLPLSPKCAADPDLLLFSVLILHSCNLSHSQSSKILGSSVGLGVELNIFFVVPKHKMQNLYYVC